MAKVKVKQLVFFLTILCLFWPHWGFGATCSLSWDHPIGPNGDPVLDLAEIRLYRTQPGQPEVLAHTVISTDANPVTTLLNIPCEENDQFAASSVDTSGNESASRSNILVIRIPPPPPQNLLQTSVTTTRIGNSVITTIVQTYTDQGATAP